MSTELTLYGYWRSSAAYRVRIALGLKGLAYRQESVHLVKDGGQQHAAEYQALNPQGLVPLLVDEGNGGVRIAQSLAILEYLDEVFPVPALLPADPAQRAQVRALALHIACDIHPLNNLRVLQYLSAELGASDEAKNAWYRHWVEVGLASVESRLVDHPLTGRFCHGDQPTIADCCLVPQVFNARRFGCDLSHVPTVLRIDAECRTLPTFQAAAPERQPDAE